MLKSADVLGFGRINTPFCKAKDMLVITEKCEAALDNTAAQDAVMYVCKDALLPKNGRFGYLCSDNARVGSTAKAFASQLSTPYCYEAFITDSK